MKKPIIFALMLVLAMLPYTSTAAASASDAEDSVVAVQSTDGSRFCSGFAVGDGYIATDAKRLSLTDGSSTTVYFDVQNNETTQASVVCTSGAIALLKIDDGADKVKPLKLCPMEYVDPDASYKAIGFSAENGWQAVGKDDTVRNPAGIRKTDVLDNQDIFVINSDAVTADISGGPFVNSKGEAAGMCVYSDSLHYAVAANEIIDLAENNDIEVKVHYDIPVWIWVLGGLAAALCAAAAVIVILRKRRPADIPPSAQVSIPISQIITGQKTVSQTYTRRKTARVSAVCGVMGGKRFDINGSHRMGRDPNRCSIIFPVNTPGVGAVHCELTFDGKVIYVRDLNSQYGTYVRGQRLEPNVPVPLRSGERFCLASADNTFEVKYY